MAFIFHQSIYLIKNIAHLHLTNWLIKVLLTTSIPINKYKQTYKKTNKNHAKTQIFVTFCLFIKHKYIYFQHKQQTFKTIHIYKQCFISPFLQTNIILFFLLLTK